MVLSRYNLIKMDGVDNVMHGNNIILPLLQLLTVIVVVRIKITPDLQLNPVITVIKVSIKNTLIFHDKSVFYNNKIGGNYASIFSMMASIWDIKFWIVYNLICQSYCIIFNA